MSLPERAERAVLAILLRFIARRLRRLGRRAAAPSFWGNHEWGLRP